MAAGERIARFKIQKESGYLYYVKADEEGWLCVYKTIATRGGSNKGKSKANDKKKINQSHPRNEKWMETWQTLQEQNFL